MYPNELETPDSNAFLRDLTVAHLTDPHGSPERFSKALNDVAEGILNRGEAPTFADALLIADRELRKSQTKRPAPGPAPSTHRYAEQIRLRADALHAQGIDYTTAMRQAYAEIRNNRKPEQTPDPKPGEKPSPTGPEVVRMTSPGTPRQRTTGPVVFDWKR